MREPRLASSHAAVAQVASLSLTSRRGEGEEGKVPVHKLITTWSKRSRGTVRRGTVAVAAAATALAGSTMAAAPAGAASSLSAPANAMIVGAGSATTYDVMVKLGTLFNAATSCDLYQPSTASSAVTPQDFSCVVDSNPNQTSPAILGASVARTPVNPFGDVAIQEPPVGSSTGIKMLSNQGAKGAAGITSGGQAISVANNVDYARSSRNIKTTDFKGLNFVAFAKDGLSWTHYVSTGATKATPTPSATVGNLTKAQLQAIFNTGATSNWSQVGGSSAPIIVFSAQVGSGTWDSWGGYVASTASYKTSDPTNKVNCYDTSDQSTCQGPAVIFENQTASMGLASLPVDLRSPTPAVLDHFGLSSATVNRTGSTKTSITAPDVCSKWIWGCTAGKVNGSKAPFNQDFTLNTPSDERVRATAITFSSTGKFNYQCSLKPAKAKVDTCGGTQPGAGYLYKLGNIEGVEPTQANVLMGTFPATRLLFNVYANGSNANIPATKAAALNFIGEQGFLCRPGTASDVNPGTGATYRSEINAAILSEGFYPISAGMSSGSINNNPVPMASLSRPASSVTSGSRYSPYTDGRDSSGNGFCIISTTDGNASS